MTRPKDPVQYARVNAAADELRRWATDRSWSVDSSRQIARRILDAADEAEAVGVRVKLREALDVADTHADLLRKVFAIAYDQ